MLSQSQRAAILELNTQAVSKREIARVLKVSRLTVREGHAIAHAVKDALLASATHGISDVTVHIEPAQTE